MRTLIVIVFVIWCVLKLSGIPASFNVLPSFLPGEKVLFFKMWVWAASGKSWPSYRWSFSVPPFMEQGLYVTDRRVLVVFYIFRTIKFEDSLWFEGRGEPGGNEFVKEVNVGKSRIVGPYLEVVSESSVKQWCRSPKIRLRLFMKNPEPIRRIIAEAMTRNSQDIQ
jgi:hypothetical protein